MASGEVGWATGSGAGRAHTAWRSAWGGGCGFPPVSWAGSGSRSRCSCFGRQRGSQGEKFHAAHIASNWRPAEPLFALQIEVDHVVTVTADGRGQPRIGKLAVSLGRQPHYPFAPLRAGQLLRRV